MLDNELIIEFTPSSEDEANVKKITDFLEEYEIPYTISDKVYGLIHIKDIKERQIELRYVSSYHYKMDNSKRFGKGYEGAPKNYFANISQGNEKKDIRTIWIFDHELRQTNDVYRKDGTKIVGHHRMWEVIKNNIASATGHIKHRWFARDFDVTEIGNDELRPFLDEHCFYGYRSATVNLGLKLKKDKNGFKRGDLIMVYTFGNAFFGNRDKAKDKKIEIIRVSTRLAHQIVGGASKALHYFLYNYPTITIAGQDVDVKDLIFIVDASHNSGNGMKALNFNFVSWKDEGFMNILNDDIDEIYERPDGKKIHLYGKKGDTQQRKPAAHKRIMDLIKEKRLYSVGNAGSIIYEINRKEYIEQLESSKQK